MKKTFVRLGKHPSFLFDGTRSIVQISRRLELIELTRTCAKRQEPFTIKNQKIMVTQLFALFKNTELPSKHGNKHIESGMFRVYRFLKALTRYQTT